MSKFILIIFLMGAPTSVEFGDYEACQTAMTQIKRDLGEGSYYMKCVKKQMRPR